jgi:hypothetical protein
VFGYTYQQPDGNRTVSGRGSLPQVEPLDLRVDGRPQWLVAGPIEGGSLWAVLLDSGQVQAFEVVNGEAREVTITPDRVPSGMPPLLVIEEGQSALLTGPPDLASPLTHPIRLSSGQTVFIDQEGNVVFWDGAEIRNRLAVKALPDARLLVDETDRILVLTAPTSRYGHGVLGDSLEAAAVTLIETEPEPQVALTIPIPEPSVVEGLAPIWADLTGDGSREIIVTLSNAEQGAQVVVFNEAGERVAAGPAIGQGHRWRHQLAVAPFGLQGALELVDVLTPHIGGTVEFYRPGEEALSIVARVPGYTSHVIRTRNLDMAAAGDFDGDGQVELLLPNQARTALGGIKHAAAGAEVAWTVPVDGTVSTNLAAVTLANDGVAIGVGRADGFLRLWLPEA